MTTNLAKTGMMVVASLRSWIKDGMTSSEATMDHDRKAQAGNLESGVRLGSCRYHSAAEGAALVGHMSVRHTAGL